MPLISADYNSNSVFTALNSYQLQILRHNFSIRQVLNQLSGYINEAKLGPHFGYFVLLFKSILQFDKVHQLLL